MGLEIRVGPCSEQGNVSLQTEIQNYTSILSSVYTHKLLDNVISHSIQDYKLNIKKLKLIKQTQ